MKLEIEQLVNAALAALPVHVVPDDAQPAGADIERTRDARHGDFATNVALRLARLAGRKPRELAELIVRSLPASPLVDKVEIAGPGFINFHLAPAAYHAELGKVLTEAAHYGRNDIGGGRPVLVEFVSANPTGPLHVGHGRLAAYGASVAALLEASGHRVEREYYVNDAGRQMDILAASVWLRYLQACGETLPFPANAYRGEYIREIAVEVQRRHAGTLQRAAGELLEGLPPDAPDGDRDEYIDAVIERARGLLGDGLRRVLDIALEALLRDIREDLEQFSVHHDTWFSERSLDEDGAIDRALERLREHGQLYEQDGAVWFRARDFGDEKDRVVVRENGQKTYFASDIAYHLHKRERGFDVLLDVLGADHHGYVARVRAGLEAMGEPGDALEVRLVQFVALFRGGKKVQMSTRSGDFVTLRELREEVGNDAARYFYVSRSNEQHLDFDLELAKSHSADNPVYYIQYAHARICSVLNKLEEQGLALDPASGRRALGRLTESQEEALLKALARYPEIVEQAALGRAPHQLAHYLRELANYFHTYYNAHRVIVDDAPLRDARLALLLGVRQVIRNGLALLGVSAPESM